MFFRVFLSGSASLRRGVRPGPTPSCPIETKNLKKQLFWHENPVKQLFWHENPVKQLFWLYRTLYSGNYSVFDCTGPSTVGITVYLAVLDGPGPIPRWGTPGRHHPIPGYPTHGWRHGCTAAPLSTVVCTGSPGFFWKQRPGQHTDLFKNPKTRKCGCFDEMWLFWRNVAVLTKLGLVLRQFWRKWLKLVVFSGFWRKTLKSVVS